jgi:hypothetical protein
MTSFHIAKQSKLGLMKLSRNLKAGALSISISRANRSGGGLKYFVFAVLLLGICGMQQYIVAEWMKKIPK